jgi:antitoxin component of MazEF toxin-antitoxin module
MIKKIFSAGGSYSILLPKSWLNLLGWEENTQVKLDIDVTNKKIIITEIKG